MNFAMTLLYQDSSYKKMTPLSAGFVFIGRSVRSIFIFEARVSLDSVSRGLSVRILHALLSLMDRLTAIPSTWRVDGEGRISG
jgi:hypothetical protein